MATKTAVKTAVTIIACFLVGSDGAVLCPANHCLMQVTDGTDAADYSCEQYPDEGYQCAYENDPRNCTCAGTVKYGNYEQFSGPAAWTAQLQVTGSSVACTNALGHPLNGPKYCWCTPAALVATTRSTKAAIDASSNVSKVGYGVPGCLIASVQPTTKYTIQVLYTAGVNQGAMDRVIDIVFATTLQSTEVKMISFNRTSSELVMLVQIVCPDANVCAAKMQEFRSDSTPLRTATDDFIAGYPEMALLAAAGIDWEILPKFTSITSTPVATSTQRATTTPVATISPVATSSQVASSAKAEHLAVTTLLVMTSRAWLA